MESQQKFLSFALLDKWDEFADIVKEVRNVDMSEKIFISETGDNVIHLAIAKADHERVCDLEKWFWNELANLNGENYLHIAVKRQHETIFNTVYKGLIKGTQVGLRNVDGETPLYMSSELGNFHIFRTLFEDYLSEIWNRQNVFQSEAEKNNYHFGFSCHMLYRSNEDNILHVSLRNRHIDIANAIMVHVPNLTLTENAWGSTPLHELAIQHKLFKSGRQQSSVCWKLFLKIISRIPFIAGKIKLVVHDEMVTEEQEKQNKKAITLASNMIQHIKKSDHFPYTWTSSKKSIPAGDGKTKNFSLESPIVLAVKNGTPEIVTEILEYFPNQIHARDTRGWNLIFLAVECRKPDMLNLLVKRVGVREKLMELVEGGNSLLHVAANFGKDPAWNIVGYNFQLCLEVIWFERVRALLRGITSLEGLQNQDGKTADEIFKETHEKLLEGASKWFDTISKAYGGVAGVVFGATLGIMVKMPSGSSTVNLIILYVLIVIVLFSSLTSTVSFLSVTCARVDERSYSNSRRSNIPFQHSIGLVFLFIALVVLFFLLGDYQILASGSRHILWLGWLTFFPIVYMMYLTCPLLCDMVQISSGELEYYVHHGERLPAETQSKQSLKKGGETKSKWVFWNDQSNKRQSWLN